MNTGLKAAALAASSLFLFGVAPAYAGADTVRAEAYFNAISGGDAEAIASFYADDAEFRWVGGPLAGVYKGRDKIKAVWEKFSEAAGDIQHEVLQLSESVNGKTSTVTARVKFKGEGEVPVKFVLVYKDGKITNEVWQVDKSGAASAKVEGRPEAKPEADDKIAEAAPPEAKPAAPASVGAVQAAVVTEMPAKPDNAARRLAANDPDEPKPSARPEASGAGYLPGGGKKAQEADAETPPSAVPLPAARKGEIGPEADRGAEPRPTGAPKAKAEKKRGYAEKAARKKRTYGYGYGYDHDYDPYYDGYGYGRRYGRYYGYDGYGYGWRGYGGYGGYGRYGGYGGY